ncbi:hypothetical protein CTAYLR_000305 [Chrysophaeum taylorii]|uniref:Cytochrome b5 heme-binding domain-containing protein n=1 Tax=Chrysophaeum taylorii TaxID=2483200 RepID=A0AAD7XMA7_9STRA|nr:hypothetical protein CTAYLR_000305 [Chrysophaeum taylorii]
MCVAKKIGPAIGSEMVAVEDKVYDVSKFRSAHPGGPMFVSMFGGRDATLAFQTYHGRPFPHDKMKEYLVGSVDDPVAPDPDLAELQVKVRAAVGAGRPSLAQKIKAVTLVVSAVLLELSCLWSRNWLKSCVLGLLFALIGLNVQHDSNHGAMRYGGWTQSWIGGSQLMWIQEHVVLHHLHTGTAMDPDAQGVPVLRLNADDPWFPWVRFQHWYILILEMGYGAIPLFGSFFEVLAWQHKLQKKYQLSELAKPWRLQNLAMSLLFYARLIVIPYFQGELRKAIATFAVGGFYLAFFFFLSHNFTEADFTQNTFFKQQVAASSNVGGSWLSWINGGLNYQIEHHLFPRIAHSHYPTIAPIVKSFVTAKGVPYVHFPTVSANLKSVFAGLEKFGLPPKKDD